MGSLIVEHINVLYYKLVQRYSPEKEADIHQQLKISMAYLFGCFAVFFLLGNAVISYLLDQKIYSIIDLTAAGAFTILFIRTKKENINQTIHLGVTFSAILFLVLFACGGSDKQGFIWSYTFPLFTFFLLGCRKGIIINTLFFLCCLLIIFADITTNYLNLYDITFGFRFFFSFLLILLFASFYEFFRSRTEKFTRQLNDNLEFQVSKRTRELKREMTKQEKLNSQLLQANKEWKLTFNAVPAMIAIMDSDNNIIRANSSLLEQINRSYEEVIGRKCCEIGNNSCAIPFFCRTENVVKTCKNSSTKIYCEEYSSHFSVTASPLYDQENSIIGTVHIAHDLSKQQEAERNNTIHIVIYDENENQNQLLTKMLESLDYTVTSFTNCIDLKHSIKNFKPDLLLYNLPPNSPIGELEINRIIQDKNTLQKTILTSGFLHTDTVIKAKKLGITTILEKPFTIEELGDAVENTLHQ